MSIPEADAEEEALDAENADADPEVGRDRMVTKFSWTSLVSV